MSDFLSGFRRGALVSPLAALGVLAVTHQSILGAAVTSAAINYVWLTNVSNVSRGSAYRAGYVIGASCGSAAVVAGSLLWG